MKMFAVLGTSIVFVIMLTGYGTRASANHPISNVSQPKSRNSQQTTTNTTKPPQVVSEEYVSPETVARYVDIAKQHPKSEPAQINAAIGCYENGDFSKAITYYQKAINDNPKDGVPYNNLGNIYNHQEKEPEVAISYYLKATKVDPSFAEAWLNLSMTYKGLGNITNERKTIITALQKINKSDVQYKYLEQELQQIKS